MCVQTRQLSAAAISWQAVPDPGLLRLVQQWSQLQLAQLGWMEAFNQAEGWPSPWPPHTLIKHSHMWRIGRMMIPPLILGIRALGMTNDMVFIKWHITRLDSPSLTWILNLIAQFISCQQTVLAIVKVSPRIRDCVFGESFYNVQHGVLFVFFLPGGQRTDLQQTMQSLQIKSFYCLESLTSLNTCPSEPKMVKRELHQAQNGSPSVQATESWIHSWFVALTHTHTHAHRV